MGCDISPIFLSGYITQWLIHACLFINLPDNRLPFPCLWDLIAVSELDYFGAQRHPEAATCNTHFTDYYLSNMAPKYARPSSCICWHSSLFDNVAAVSRAASQLPRLNAEVILWHDGTNRLSNRSSSSSSSSLSLRNLGI